MDFCDELLSPRIFSESPTFIDVGANVGQWAIAAKFFVPSAKVLSIEPDPEVYAMLVKNISGVQGVECVNSAAGSRSGTTLLFRQALSLMSTINPSKDDLTTDPVEVTIRRLDELTKNYPAIDVLKIDVEGSEVEVLRGAPHTLEKSSYLLIELSLARGNTNAIELLTELKRMQPKSRIIKFGRPLGSQSEPACQDVLISLRS